MIKMWMEKQDGADEDQEIAELGGQALRNAEKIEADDGQRHAEPDEQAASFFEEQPEERDDDDIEGRNEPRLAHGRVHDADLLKTPCEQSITPQHTPPIQSWPFDFAFEGLMPPGETGFSLLSSAMQGMRNRPPIKERTQVNV